MGQQVKNFLVQISYCGSRYHGFAVQKNALSVMQVLQDAIEQTVGVREDIKGCSRTDAGVHAKQYYFSFQSCYPITPAKLADALNHYLPNDIAVISAQYVPLDFHARYDCRGKEYIYLIHNASYKDPFLQNMCYYYRYPIHCELLQQAAESFIGRHDFTSFCSFGAKEGDKSRTVYSSSVYRQGEKVYFKVSADGFVYNMVRIMVGTLLKVNQGKIRPEEIQDIIRAKDRRVAGPTAPPQGLYLNRVFYDEKIFSSNI